MLLNISVFIYFSFALPNHIGIGECDGNRMKSSLKLSGVVAVQALTYEVRGLYYVVIGMCIIL